ncbi:hypothetical protein ElyMa_004517300 [Elysia marginata]|uniref:Uncharacterized protein n=1 Tax=Elysia marginata TaxID=1093978 RepID=A0AAV4HQZ2_9GAST|nr:hypothetical protein ElyMa_004517300 [Elysia marginata]
MFFSVSRFKKLDKRRRKEAAIEVKDDLAQSQTEDELLSVAREKIAAFCGKISEIGTEIPRQRAEKTGDPETVERGVRREEEE